MLASAPVTAEEVVKAIVAVTLKVPIAKISMDSNTIKDLAAGWFLVLGLHPEP
jgi:3-oxoacyl-ACP reductase-like protein